LFRGTIGYSFVSDIESIARIFSQGLMIIKWLDENGCGFSLYVLWIGL
jgi:hypothetical protein